jgi:hypothetical protein
MDVPNQNIRPKVTKIIGIAIILCAKKYFSIRSYMFVKPLKNGSVAV